MAEKNLQETLTGAVVVPFLQAAITGTLIGLSVGGGAAFLAWERPAALGLTVGSLSATWAWLNYRGGWQMRLEALLGVDINRDGTIGEPAAQAGPLRVEVISEEGRHGDYLDLPAKLEQLIALGDGLMSGDGFAVGRWTGSRGIFTRGEFETLRAELLKRGYLRWANDHARNQGVELTGKGRALMRGFASLAQNHLQDVRLEEHSPTTQIFG